MGATLAVGAGNGRGICSQNQVEAMASSLQVKVLRQDSGQVRAGQAGEEEPWHIHMYRGGGRRSGIHIV